MTINEKVATVISAANDMQSIVDSIKLACYFDANNLQNISGLATINEKANELKLACEAEVTPET
jgi:predicted RNA-binding protein with EMAP domain